MQLHWNWTVGFFRCFDKFDFNRAPIDIAQLVKQSAPYLLVTCSYTVLAKTESLK